MYICAITLTMGVTLSAYVRRRAQNNYVTHNLAKRNFHSLLVSCDSFQ